MWSEQAERAGVRAGLRGKDPQHLSDVRGLRHTAGNQFDRRLFGIDEMPRADIERHARTVAEHVAKTLQA